MSNTLHGEYFYNYDKIRISSHKHGYKNKNKLEQAKD